MISLATTLTASAERYLACRECCKDYAQAVRSRVRRFAADTGENSIAALEPAQINAWLAGLADEGLTPETVDGYRRAVLAVWRYLYEEGAAVEPPLRVRRIRKPPHVIEAFRRDQVRALIRAADSFAGHYGWGVPKGQFWAAAVRAGYASGLRRGDLLRAELGQLRADGTFTIVQHKTGHVHRGRLDAETRRLILAIPRDDERWLPWDIGLNYFGADFRKLRGLAGIKTGTFRWLRRAAGSYAELERPGTGSKVLGHRDARVFTRHYEDRSITEAEPLAPPSL